MYRGWGRSLAECLQLTSQGMQPQQWFMLWMTLISTVGGGLVTLAGIWLAFRFNVINTVAQDQRVRARETLIYLEDQLARAHITVEGLLAMPLGAGGIRHMLGLALGNVRAAVAHLPIDPVPGESPAATIARPVRVMVERAAEQADAHAALRELDELIARQRQLIASKLS